MSADEAGVTRRAFRVVGRVQGVGFRWWTQHTAEELGLGGWVRNERDGSVVVHAIGPDRDVRRLEEVLREGPMASRVDRVDEIAPAGGLSPGAFRIEF